MPELKAGKMCAVCGEALHQIRPLDKDSRGWPTSQTQAVTVTAGNWIHAREFSGTVDHPAVPVDYDEANLVAKCDFCGDNMGLDERWYLDAEDFTVFVVTEGAGELRHNSRSGWSSCPTCAPLVAAQDWPAIIKRHMSKVGELYSTNVATFIHDHMLPALLSSLEEHTLAPIRPWQPGDEKSLRE